MKKRLLALAVLGAVAPQGVQALPFKVGEDVQGNIGFKSQVLAQRLGERVDGNKGATEFFKAARLYANANVGDLTVFSANMDFDGAGSRLTDGFIGLWFSDEVKVQAGILRTPFSRSALTDEYTYLTPTGYFYGGVPVDRGFGGARGEDDYRNAGIVAWGDVMGRMVKYYVGIFDGPYSNGVDEEGKDNLMYALRLQFTPTMLGYQGESGYTLRNTYLGNREVLSFGFGYARQKEDSFMSKALTFDVKHEQKFGGVIAGWEAAYFNVKDVNEDKDDRKGFYLQVHGIYDRVMGIGKPGVAVRYERSEEKLSDGESFKFKRIGGAASYFIKGQRSYVQLAVDRVDNPEVLKDYTDLTLALKVQF